MTNILIKNGRIIDPANKVDMIGDLLIENGKIKAVGKIKDATADTIIDAKDKIIAPGLIDLHVHLREPGREEEETIASGSAAAVTGGFTSVACMPNTDPAIDNEATVEFILNRSAAAKMANVFPVGAITKERKGESLAEMGQMVRAGAVAFTDDGSGVQDPSVMLRAFQYAKMFNKVVMQHCQDDCLAGNGCMNAGYYATILGLPGMSPLAEEIMLYRDVQLAKAAGARYHAQHLSTAGSVDIVRQAKAQGLPVTAEATPHHLLLTEKECETYDTNFKMNPPLRTQADLEALRQGVADGTIDCLATDHAPHLKSAKELEFPAAPFGIVGLDCALGLYAKALIESGTIDWPLLIKLMTINPAKILTIDKGTLSEGADADITIIDPNYKWKVDTTKFISKSQNCPYNDWQLTAKPVITIVGGQIKFQL
ncbi:MAG: dihydroorotase [Phycisphaerae bacterium]|nr:dihydroorotase [Phycisphaerae bacterium]